jgi:hypothetical protein
MSAIAHFALGIALFLIAVWVFLTAAVVTSLFACAGVGYVRARRTRPVGESVSSSL